MTSDELERDARRDQERVEAALAHLRDLAGAEESLQRTLAKRKRRPGQETTSEHGVSRTRALATLRAAHHRERAARTHVTTVRTELAGWPVAHRWYLLRRSTPYVWAAGAIVWHANGALLIGFLFMAMVLLTASVRPRSGAPGSNEDRNQLTNMRSTAEVKYDAALTELVELEAAHPVEALDLMTGKEQL